MAPRKKKQTRPQITLSEDDRDKLSEAINAYWRNQKENHVKRAKSWLKIEHAEAAREALDDARIANQASDFYVGDLDVDWIEPEEKAD